MDKNWRPPEGWKPKYPDEEYHGFASPELASALYHRRHIARTAYEEGASAIIMPVREATLKEVGEWLKQPCRKHKIEERVDCHVCVLNLSTSLEQGRMPTELIENLNKLGEAENDNPRGL
jgi:hypothetical protein